MNVIDKPGGDRRVMVRLPEAIQGDLLARAASNRRSLSSELLVLIESGLAAEKAASNHTA